MQPLVEVEVRETVEKWLEKVTSTDTDPEIVTLLRDLYRQEFTARPVVHPLFRYSQWDDKDFDKKFKKRYLSILPALALASHYLTLPRTTNYIYALLWCPTKIKLDSRARSFEEFTWLCRNPDKPLRPEAQKRYDAWLMHLVPHLRLSVQADMADNCCATAYPDTRYRIAKSKPGVPSYIEVNRKFIRMIEARLKPGTRSSRTLPLHWKHLATTLIHELIHSIVFAQSGMHKCEGREQAKEKWFAEDTYVEIGYSWEYAANGGLIHLSGDELSLNEMDRKWSVFCYKCADPRVSFPVDCTCEGKKGGFIRQIKAKEVTDEFKDLLARRL